MKFIKCMRINIGNMLIGDISQKEAKTRDCDSASKISKILPMFRQASGSRKVLARSMARERESVTKRITLLEKDRKQLNLKPIIKKNSVSHLSITHKGLFHKEAQVKEEKAIQSQTLVKEYQVRLPQLKLDAAKTFQLRTLKNEDEDRFPMTGLQASTKFSKFLTQFQQQQIKNYSEVFYVGNPQLKNKRSAYVDNVGSFICKSGDCIAYRYQVQKLVGKGSFGHVYKVYDHKEKQCVAIKVIKNRPKFTAQGQSQIRMLLNLGEDERSLVVRLHNHFNFRGHLCMVFDLLYCNLYQLIRHNGHQSLSLQFIRKVAVQMLQSLAIFSSKKIMHCDLKPQNVMLKAKGSSVLKVIDLGSSCFQHQVTQDYIQSRFYRAPQVLLGLTPFTGKIDIWSLFTILAEMYLGCPLFPGQDQTQQILNIGEVLGCPPQKMIKESLRGSWYFQSGEFSILDKKGNLRKVGSRPLCQILGKTQFTDFLSRGLVWLSEQRMTPQEGLQHPWITGKVQEESVP